MLNYYRCRCAFNMGADIMKLSYDGLWEMLYNLSVSKMEFARNVGISNATLAKLGKNEPISLMVLMRICEHYNCKIENIVKFIPDMETINPKISTIKVGTILICTSFPLGTSVFSKTRSVRTNILRKHPGVVLQECLNDGYVPKILVAPLSYNLYPDTIFDIQFKDLALNDNFIKSGYIQLGKIGFVFQEDVENIIGYMPEYYLQKAFQELEKIKSIIKF